MTAHPIIAVAAAVSLLSASIVSAASSPATTDVRCSGAVRGNQPPLGLLGDRAVALKIAATYLSAIYGAEIGDELPLKATIRNGVWHVEGSLRPGWKGGVAEIEMCQATGRVLFVQHGK